MGDETNPIPSGGEMMRKLQSLPQKESGGGGGGGERESGNPLEAEWSYEIERKRREKYRHFHEFQIHLLPLSELLAVGDSSENLDKIAPYHFFFFFFFPFFNLDK